MHVEPPGPDDLGPLVRQWVALAREQQAYGTHIRAEENRATVRESLAHHVVSDTALVARADDGDLLGFVTVSRSTGGYETDVTRGTVENLYVRPEDRNRGVGSSLLAAAEQRLAEMDVDVVSLEAMAENAAARRFYEREGYDPHRVEYEKSLRDESDTKGD